MRAYRDDADIRRIAVLVSAFAGMNVHVADLPYRLCSPSACTPELTQVWEDADGVLLAFGIVQKPWGTLDYFIRPGAGDVSIEDELMTWAIRRFQELTHERGHDLDWWIDTREDLHDRSKLAGRYGFAPDGTTLVHMERLLEGGSPEPHLPEGFTIRSLAGIQEAATVAALQRAAFGSNNMTAEWRERTLRMPEYSADLDLVAVAPDGRIAASCLCWSTSDGQEAQVEPLVVHPDFQRQGLGQALLYEAFRRMRARGARIASVETYTLREPARALYEAVGFRPRHSVVKYARAFSVTN